jgi:hypothetical protein
MCVTVCLETLKKIFFVRFHLQGVIGSPQLLLLSGVGPANQLQKLKVNIKMILYAVRLGLGTEGHWEFVM